VNISIIVGILLTGIILCLIVFVAYQAKQRRMYDAFVIEDPKDQDEQEMDPMSDSFVLDDEPQDLDPKTYHSDDDDNTLIEDI